jgi:outer membrane protein OmpA-like peptidoglycan-associated protein
MSGKSLLFLGLVISALFMYLCIDAKKDALYAELIGNQETTKPAPKPMSQPVSIAEVPKEEIEEEIVQKPKEEPIVIAKEKKAPSFAYITTGSEDKIAGFLSKEDENSTLIHKIDKLCQNTPCIKEIKFFEEVTPCSFTDELFGLIEYSKKEKIKNFSLLIDNKTLAIEGKLTKQEQYDTIKPYLDAFVTKGYQVNNLLEKKNLAPVVKEEIIKEEIITAAEDEFVILSHLSIDEAESEINQIILQNPITFEYRSSQLTQESKKTLSDIVDILLGLDNVMIEVAGYTDAQGDTIYNKVLSQKRADTVRNYLIRTGVRSKVVKSVGYGEANPISDPTDISNRRVEIHLKEGV